MHSYRRAHGWISCMLYMRMCIWHLTSEKASSDSMWSNRFILFDGSRVEKQHLLDLSSSHQRRNNQNNLPASSTRAWGSFQRGPQSSSISNRFYRCVQHFAMRTSNASKIASVSSRQTDLLGSMCVCSTLLGSHVKNTL